MLKMRLISIGPNGSYKPDWAIAFERGKIACARRLFNEFSGEDVRYDVVHSYQDLLNVIQGME